MEMKKSLIKLQCVAALMLTVGAPTMQSVSLVHADTTTQTQKDATSFEAKLTSKSEQPGTVLLRHTGGKELSLTKVELIDKDGKSLATIYDAAKEDASVTKKGDDIFVKFNAPKAEGMTVKVSYDKSKLGDKEAIATVAVLLKDNGGTAASKQFNAKTESKDAINKSMDDALNELKELNKDTSKKEDDSKKDDTSKKEDDSKNDDSKKDESKKEDDSKKDDSKKDDSKKDDTSKKEDDSKKDESKKDDSKKDDSKKDETKPSTDLKKDDSKKDETKPSTDLKKEDTNKKDDKLPETKPSTDDKKDDVKKDETKPSTDVKKDDVKKDETKPSTDVKKDDVKKDETKPSTDVKKDDVKKDETKPSTDVKKDDVKKEEGNGKNDRPSLDDLKKDETKPSTDVKKDETKTAPTADAKNLFAPIVKEKYDLSTHRVDRAKTISELLVSSYEKASKNSKLSDNVKAEKEAADKAVANLKAEAAKTSATPESLNKAYSPAFDAVKALSDKIDGKVSNTVKKDDVKKDETKPSTDVKKDDVKKDQTKPSTDVKKDDVKKNDVKKDDVKKDETKPSTDVKKDEVKSDETKKDETAPSSDVKKDEVKSDDTTKDETKPSTDVKQDQTQPSSSAKIQGKAPIKGKYANTNEKTNPIAVIAGALGLALAGIAGVIGWKKHKESNENESSEN